MIADLFRYRAFVWRHARADLRHRYAGTGLGVAWNVLHPLALIAVYSVVFGRVFRPAATPPGTGRLPYTVYLCSGLFPWLGFADGLTRACDAFPANAAYLRKLPVPEPVFVARAAAASTLGLAVNIALLLVVMLALGWRPAWTWLLVPVPLLLLQSLGFGVGLLLATFNVFLRDTAQWLAVALQLGLWTVPVVYRLDAVPRWVAAALAWHPLWPALSAVRSLLLDHAVPPAATWLAMTAWPLAAVLVGGAVLHHLRPEIRDVI